MPAAKCRWKTTKHEVCILLPLTRCSFCALTRICAFIAVQHQMNDMAHMQKTVSDLERAFVKMKQEYGNMQVLSPHSSTRLLSV